MMTTKTVQLEVGPEITYVQAPGKQAYMEKAFSMVCPKSWGRSDWRERVLAVLTNTDLETVGVTLADVCESIEFFTATEPKLRYSQRLNGEPCYIIEAEGYRRGPAA